MLNIGDFNTLSVQELVDDVLVLVAEGTDDKVILPAKEVLEPLAVDDNVIVFVYRNRDVLMATLKQPLAKANEVAFLQVVDVTSIGAFLNWGLPKDLLLPYSEQGFRQEVGRYYLVYLYIDKATHRIVASGNLNKFIKNREIDLNEWDAVDIIIAEKHDLGFKVIVNHKHWGFLYENELFKPVKVGETHTAYVKKIREDGKIDLSLQPLGLAGIDQAAQDLLTQLKDHDGFLPIHDKSAPELISSTVQMSKKSFKKAVGSLYKKRLISIDKEGITLLEKSKK